MTAPLSPVEELIDRALANLKDYYSDAAEDDFRQAILSTVFSEGKVREMLAVACAALGSHRAFAQKAGISQAYLSNVLNGRCDVTETLARCVGVKRAVIFYFDGAPEWPKQTAEGEAP